MNTEKLIRQTKAYKILVRDKKAGSLSHAYLLTSEDEAYLKDYLKIFAKVMVCEEEEEFCDKCRSCRTVDTEKGVDVKFYGVDRKIVAADADEIVADTFVKPYELDKKLYVLSNADDMNAAAQNKLLKTLEEPPANTYLLLGAKTDFSLLPTVKSRVKKLDIPPFSPETIFELLKEEYPDKERALEAASCCNGTVGDAERLYKDEALMEITDLVAETLIGMKSSKDLSTYSSKIMKYKDKLKEVFSVTELLLKDMLADLNGATVINGENLKKVSGHDFKTASLIYALNAVSEAEKRKYYNGNDLMVVEWLLFQILEGKYRCQKL